MNILIIEDDLDAAEYLSKGLSESGYHVTHAADGEAGLSEAESKKYDVLIVDRMLPKLDGLTVISNLRAQRINTPALILSALDQVDERVKGLSAGGDDYLTKPYSFSELTARIQALVRRAKTEQDGNILKVDGLLLDQLKRKVTRDGVNIHLQPREFRLLEYLMRNAGQIVTRKMLLENVWDYQFDPQTNLIDVQISRLRGKIDKEFDHSLLHTVRGAGYTLGARDE